jgi:hypothetical protein
VVRVGIGSTRSRSIVEMTIESRFAAPTRTAKEKLLRVVTV